MYTQAVTRILTVVVLGMLAVSSAYFSWSLYAFLKPSPVSFDQPNVSGLPTRSQPSSSPVYLPTPELFGAADMAAKSSQKTPMSRQARPVISKAKVKLAGIVAGERARAAVLQFGGQQRAYLAGESVDYRGERFQVLQVLPDRIRILRKGVTEEVLLDPRKAAGVASRQIAGKGAAQERRINLRSSAYRSVLGDAGKLIRERPLSLAKFFSLTPVSDQGKVVAYKVYPGADRRLYAKLGLRRDDRITAINGVTVDRLNPLQLPALLAKESNIRVDLLRNQQVLTLNLVL